MTGAIVILTGAGVSAESGLGTFRDKGGLWSEYDLEDVATPQGFARNPALVHDFYNARRANALDAAPNAAHVALAELAKAMPDRVTLVTQNIDNLHERAGHTDVIHMHGEIMQALCGACGARWPAPKIMTSGDACPECGAKATRPDIVWFGEIPYHMDRIEASLVDAETFVAIGTSGQVYPAAGYVDIARQLGIETIEINLEPSDRDGLFDRQFIGPATQTVPAWVQTLLSS